MISMDQLRKKHKKNKKSFNDDFSLRTYRAISWLSKAYDLACDEEYDLSFITLWIGFNALYAGELPLNQNRSISDKYSFKEFLQKIRRSDRDKRLYHLIWNRYPHSIRTLLDNKYTFTPFWLYQNGTYSETAWSEDFIADKKKANQYLQDKENVDLLLMIIFERLYTLRNQIVHGGATYDSSVNRTQLKDAVKILNNFLPLITDIMLNNPNEDWGKPFYPPVDDARLS